MTPTNAKRYEERPHGAAAVRLRRSFRDHLSLIDAQWRLRDLGQNERNAVRKAQWATRLRFICP